MEKMNKKTSLDSYENSLGETQSRLLSKHNKLFGLPFFYSCARSFRGLFTMRKEKARNEWANLTKLEMFTFNSFLAPEREFSLKITRVF